MGPVSVRAGAAVATALLVVVAVTPGAAGAPSTAPVTMSGVASGPGAGAFSPAVRASSGAANGTLVVAAAVNRTFGGNDTDTAYGLVRTGDGGFAVAGWTDTFAENDSFGTARWGAWLVRSGPDGAERWNETYEMDGVRAIVDTPDGGFALVGYEVDSIPNPTDSSNRPTALSGDSDGRLVKTDANGVVQRDRSYSIDLDLLSSAAGTRDGGFGLGGTVYIPGSGRSDHAWLVKASANGTEEWNRTYRGSGIDGVVQAADGGFAFVSPLLTKVDANGTEAWNATFSTNDTTRLPRAIVRTADGGYALAGYAVPAPGNRSAWLAKVDANGTEEWNRTYGGDADDGIAALVGTADGGFLLAGATESFGAGKTDAWLVKVDANGTEAWNATFGGSGYDGARALARTSDGGYAFAGGTSSFGAGGTDAWLVKVTVGPCEPGDANLDGSVSSGDASVILRRVVDLPTSGFGADCADPNGDGSITSGDASLVLRKVVGLPVG